MVEVDADGTPIGDRGTALDPIDEDGPSEAAIDSASAVEESNEVVDEVSQNGEGTVELVSAIVAHAAQADAVTQASGIKDDTEDEEEDVGSPRAPPRPRRSDETVVAHIMPERDVCVLTPTNGNGVVGEDLDLGDAEAEDSDGDLDLGGAGSDVEEKTEPKVQETQTVAEAEAEA